MILKLLSITTLIATSIHFSFAVECKDDNDVGVDWFINIKLPKIAQEPKGSPLYNGVAYAYLTPKSAQSSYSWTLSPHSILSENSMLGNTWKSFHSEKQSLTYLFYNDETPESHAGSTVGHLKGMLAFNQTSGIWITHSIPRFGEANKYNYPLTAVTNGQHIFCVNFKVSEINAICHHLLFCNPNIYIHQLTNSVSKYLDEKTISLFTNKPQFVKRPPLQKKTMLFGEGDLNIMAFAKDNQLHVDVYSDIVAPGLDSSLVVETWRRGSGTILRPFCQTNYSVVDIKSISMKTINHQKSINFKSTEDHSKWAISISQKKSWVCIGDLNRMVSQSRRGGGVLCFQSLNVWKSFRHIIDDYGSCAI